jgi:alpha-mannosidase
VRLPFVERTISADFGPFQVRTFRVPLDPQREVTEVDLLEWAIDEPVP